MWLKKIIEYSMHDMNLKMAILNAPKAKSSVVSGYLVMESIRFKLIQTYQFELFSFQYFQFLIANDVADYQLHFDLV